MSTITLIITPNGSNLKLTAHESEQVSQVLGIVAALQKDLQDNPQQPAKQLELLSEFSQALHIWQTNPDTLLKLSQHLES